MMWPVGELELPREHVELGGGFGGLDDPALLAINPRGRIAVIQDDLAAV